LKKQKSVGFFLLRIYPQMLIKCTDLALHITYKYTIQKQMTTITKSIVFKWKIIGHETYKFTNCKKLYNTKTMREIKKSVNGYSVGFWINKKFVILKNLKPLLVKIEKEYCPF